MDEPTMKRILLPALSLLLTIALAADAQFEKGARKGKGGPGARNAEPQWLMPPVTGPNLHYKTFASKAAATNVSYLIYLPPDYETARERRYPVMYWLHGIGGSQQGVPMMAERFTKAIAAGKTPPMIVVYVNGMIRSSYVDSANGKWPVETVTIKELIPHIDQTYRTQTGREGRIVEGFSMGGSGAAKWGFKYPELFGTVSILAGALFDNAEAMSRRDSGKSFQEIYGTTERFDASNPWKLVEKNLDQIRGRTAIRIVVGGNDPLKTTNERYHALLERLGLKHEFHIIPDAIHSPNPLYEGLGDKNWDFLRAALTGKAVSSAAAPQAAHAPIPKAEPPPTTPTAQTEAGTKPGHFQLSGERWTCDAGGQPFSGILLKPDGNGPFPAVLISHGLGGSAESFGLNKAREMVRWGFVCIAPNYTHNVRGATRGGGQRSAHPPDYGASEENIRRARACVEILRGLPYVDGKRIAAYGHSMGGFVTIGLAAAEPTLLKAAAITGSGVAPQAGYPAPSAELAAKIRTPFLILHGGNDPVVRPEQSASLKEVLNRNRVPNERRVFDGEGHAIDQSKREEVFGAVRDWFCRHGLLQP